MNYEWLMVDTTHCKVHPHAKRAKGGNPDMAVIKIWLNTKVHLAVDTAGMPV